MERREFLKAAGAGAFALVANTSAGGQRTASSAGDREVWVDVMRRLADPVLTNLAQGRLKARMPVEQAPGADRRSVTHLEALGRLLAGMAPWLELAADDTVEGQSREKYRALALEAIAHAVDPSSADFLNFTRERQPLVDAAFLGQALLRAPTALSASLDEATKRHLVAALESTRTIVPGYNNWLLFSATIEAALKRLDAEWDRLRVDYALRQHEQWYKGDGAYGDGPDFHWDYYNSFVIHPMLLDVLDACADENAGWKQMMPRVEQRAQRYAAVQERLIAPDGSFPPIGRSLAYRFGAFHLLAQMALRRALPDGMSPSQVRAALTAVIRRSIDAAGTFDADGWLRIGFCGHQPGIGETYISTGSLYLCSVGLLPLGLPPADPFWSAPAEPWTSAAAWSGERFAIDHALNP
ncbi:MAG: hypothetical protein DMF84_17350 [Acidobacteria bacterium]|nr:MAG: hypothetical protein DMF84_17350 [Acidobacteriota bacterium]